MTAEIAILNKSAIALAADSAVTISGPKGEKIYNAANKLFNLSKYHPLGIMIYGNADFMNIPWETIIKSYRDTINKIKLKDTVQEQAIDFIDFIKNGKNIFPADFFDNYKLSKIYQILNLIKYNINKKVEDETIKKGKVNISEIINKELEFQLKWFSQHSYHNNYQDNDISSFFQINKRLIINARNIVFQKIPFSKTNRIDLIRIIFSTLYKDHALCDRTGIVIAGFGKTEYLPSLFDFEIYYFIDGELFYKLGKNDNNVSGSLIRPYAQPNMIHTFIQGINPNLYNSSYIALKNIFTKLTEDYKNIPEIKNMRKTKRNQLIDKLKNLHNVNLNSFFEEINNAIKYNFTDPVVDSIASLPKEELAVVAESLVYLTFMRKRMSEEPETVGGDIDVAVISKGDGFIWIKRKHYFKPELNPHFLKNYFR